MKRVFILFFMIYLWPSYLVIESTDLARTLYGLYIPIIALFICFVSLNIDNIKVPKEVLIFLFVNVLYFVLFFSTLDTADLRRLFLPLKSILQAIFFICCFNIISYEVNKNNWLKFWNISNKFGLLLCVIMLVQLFTANPLIFSAISAADYVSYVGVRSPGTFEWGYSTCFILSYFLVGNFLYFVNNLKLKYFVFFALYCFCIISTQSKSGYVGIMVSMTFSLAFSYFFRIVPRVRLVWSVSVFLVIFITSISLFIYNFGLENFSHILNFINSILGDADIDGSTSTRLRQANIALSEGFLYWDTGFPGSFDYIIENAYLDYFYRYGIWGAIYYCLLLISLIIISIKYTKAIVKSNYSFSNNVIAISICSTIISLIVFSTSGSVFDGYKTSLWVAFIFSILVIQKKQHTNLLI